MTEEQIQFLWQKALAKQLNGELESALLAYRELLEKEPCHAQAWHHLGLIHFASGRHDQALVCFQKSLSVEPDDPDTLNDLALVYKRLQKTGEAVHLFEKALSMAPQPGRIHFNLANLYRESGREPEAIHHYLKAIEQNPRDHEAYKNLGTVYWRLGRLTEARQASLQSLAFLPGQAGVYYNLGLMDMTDGDWHKASQAFAEALRYDPSFTDAYLNRGIALQKQGKHVEAVVCFQKALEQQPRLADAYYNLGLAFEQSGDLQKELDTQYRALNACPDRIQTWIGALRTFSKICDWPCLETWFAKTVAHPFSAAEESLLSTLLYVWHAFPFTDSALFEKHALWGDYALQKYRQANADLVFDFQALKSAGSKIRIGYVSPDFGRHSVGWFFNTLIQFHDAERFEIFCYAAAERDDDLSQTIAQKSTFFKDARHWNTRAFAEEVYRDRIQILVDLAGHTRNHRLDVFALKPAPVQVTAFGYPNGTGLPTVDYRVSDPFAEGPSARDAYREKLVLLSRFFLPLGPLAYTRQSMTRSQWGLPEAEVLFVSFNRSHKLRSEVLKIWNAILDQCPEAVLAFSCPFVRSAQLQANLLAHFTTLHARSRVFFLERTENEEDHRARYGLADLALDTFPYSGTTTSYEALYLNVPVITLAGDRHVQRTTYSLLKHLGLDETIAYSKEEYLEKAVTLARSPALRGALKSKLRVAMQKTLSACPNYVRELEQAYQIMWQRYQNGEPSREIIF